MILPILTTGIKLLQATRSQASSGSNVASRIIGKQTRVVGRNVGRPRAGLIIRPRPTKISGAKFLQTTTDPGKNKLKAKGGFLLQFASILNAINQFLSLTLRILISDNKLTQKLSERERRRIEKFLKRRRESNLESDQSETIVPSSKTKSRSGSFFDRIIKFVSAIIIGSLVLALFKNFSRVIKFFKDTYETIKDFFKKLGDFISPLWDTFIFIAGIFSPLNKLKPNDDLEYAKEIEKEDSNINKTLDEGGVEGGESIDELGAAILKEDEENLQTTDKINRGLRFLRPLEAGTLDGKPIREDRSFAKEMIKRHEGLSLRAYRDTKGLLHVGYGHKIDADSPEDIRKLKEGDLITRERAVQLFEFDFNDNLNAAQKIPGFFKGTKKQQAALIDLTFNLGPNFLDNFPMMGRAIEGGNFKEAARQLQFADPDNRPGVKSGYVQDVGPRRSDPILNLLQDKGVKDFIHLQDIMNQVQSIDAKRISDSISSISFDDMEDDSPILVSVPQQQMAMGGGSSTKVILVGGVNTLDKLKDVPLAVI